MLIEDHSAELDARYQKLCASLQTHVYRQRWTVTGGLLGLYGLVAGGNLVGWWVLPVRWADWLQLMGVVGLPGLIYLTVWEWGLWDRRRWVLRRAQQCLPVEPALLYALGARAMAEAAPVRATAERALLAAVIYRLFPLEVVPVVEANPDPGRPPLVSALERPVLIDLAAFDGAATASPVAAWRRGIAAQAVPTTSEGA